MLLAAAALLAVLSEILVGAIEPFVETFGLSPFFVGVILIPTIGNLAEHLVAVQLALQEQDGVRDGGLVRGEPPGRAVRRARCSSCSGSSSASRWTSCSRRSRSPRSRAAVAISALIAYDGESNWLEGALLMLVYVILAVSFFEFR